MKKTLLFLFAFASVAFNVQAQCDVPITQTGQWNYAIGPNNDTVYCYNDPVTEILGTYVAIKGGSGDYSYQWYYTIDLSNYSAMQGVWESPNTAWILIDGATEAMYDAPPVTQSIRYKRVTTDVNCPSLTRNDFSYILHLYKVDEIEAVQKTCSPAVAASIKDKTVDPLWKNRSATWESSHSETGPFTTIVGATQFLYAPVVQSEIMYYRRSITVGSYIGGTCATQVTNAVAINPVACLPFSTEITGPVTVIPNQTATYSVPDQPGMQYLWSVTSGTITGGQGTYTITIMWDGGASANARTAIADYSVAVTETNDAQASKTTTQNITMTTTGINKGFASSGISVFPNPVTHGGGQFVIEMPAANTDVAYNIYSVAGLPVQSGSFTSLASGNTVNTELPAGMYQLVLNYNGVFTGTRLVVAE